MIELVSEDRCIRCDICERVCPAIVFDRDASGLPVIARQDDCQTCFLCEIYCPTDALYVSPIADRPDRGDAGRGRGAAALRQLCPRPRLEPRPRRRHRERPTHHIRVAQV